MRTTLLQSSDGDTVALHAGGPTVVLHPSGDVKKIVWDDLLFNGYVSSPFSGAIGAIYLRQYEGGHIGKVARLNGRGSDGQFAADSRGAVYCGRVGECDYTLRLAVGALGWYYRLELTGRGTFDALYTFDTGVGDYAFIRNNELYAAQYLGHTPLQTQYGYAIESRQNLPQSCGHPALLQGAIDIRVERYATDAAQFFGSEYRVTGRPRLLYADLPNVNRQYETPLVALQTERFSLDGKRAFAFFAHTIRDLPHAVERPSDYDRVIAEYRSLEFSPPLSRPTRLRTRIGAPVCGRPDDEGDWPAACILPERDNDGRLLSAFLPDGTHVVGQRKERLVERPHGNVMLGLFDVKHAPRNVLSATTYMYGLFLSQLSFGNTTFNRFLSVARGQFDVNKTDGLRIWLEENGVLRPLSVPTLYYMGAHFSRYVYHLPDDELDVTVYLSAPADQAVIKWQSRSGRAYRLVASMRFDDDQTAYRVERKRCALVFTPQAGTPAAVYAPDLAYTVCVDAPHRVSDDRVFFEDNIARDGQTVTYCLEAAAFTLTIDVGHAAKPPQPFECAREKYRAFYDDFLSGLRFAGQGADKINMTAHWFAHDALVHYAAPHGLEQTGGAAWGTRDVCQGAVELLMTLGKFSAVREILLAVFCRQRPSGEWPQWFMFDEYPFAADDCHGDVVFWPLKSLADYLERTDDRDFLRQAVDCGGRAVSIEGLTLRALDHIESRIDDNGLLSYGGGDWDDTLQPADPAMRARLVSAWTMALGYQTLTALSAYPPFSVRATALCDRLRRGFRLLDKDGVIAGFGCKTDDGVRLLLHPDDHETGIRLRLLPLTRSILARLVDLPQANANVAQIDARLRCPDGVRLTDAPTRYAGGVSRLFQRAEQAANVGREIGLMYVHAHLRYVEAMAALGRGDDAAWGLAVVNPIGIAQAVPNALPRQSNAYFSSSDADCPDRYAFGRDFSALRDGAIAVRGGWRVYSSGGGLYLARLIGDVYGLRPYADGLVVDPVLSRKYPNNVVTLNIFGKKVTVCYHISDREILSQYPNNVAILNQSRQCTKRVAILNRSFQYPKQVATLNHSLKYPKQVAIFNHIHKCTNKVAILNDDMDLNFAARVEINGKKVGRRLKNPYRAGGFFVSRAELQNADRIDVYTE